MPVKWLYVLQSGTVVAPADGGSGSIVNVSGASLSNPIVGRIAYWTDDETCKVNINTAGGDDGNATGAMPPVISNGVASANTYANIANATFWDVPHFNTPDDLAMGTSQPTRGEYQRYPGHPGATALNYLISSLMGSNLNTPDFFALTPRYTFGGSEGGTVSTLGAAAIPNKADRLYASVEEMLFDAADRKPSVINSQSAANSAAMDAANFFLTAHSNAPELNLFGEPRISLWPIRDEGGGNSWPAATPVPTDKNYITAFDQSLAFCSTLIFGENAYPYYFTRINNCSASADVNLPRNQVLLNYLDNLTSRTIPGFGGNFDAKYTTAGTRQILTEIFDYVRTINSMDPNFPSDGSALGGYPTNIYAAGTPSSGNVVGDGISVGGGQVVPTVSPSVKGTVWNAQGYGSFPRLVEADLQLVALGAGAVPTATPPTAAIPVFSDQPGTRIGISADGTPPPNNVAVQAYLLLNFINPAHNFPWMANESVFFAYVTGLNGFKLGGNNMGFTKGDTAIGCTMKNSELSGGYGMNGYLDFRSMVAARTLGPGFANGNTTTYPFYSNIMAIPSGTTPFTGGNITIQIYAPSNTSYTHSSDIALGDAIQTYNINFPSATFPVPALPLPVTNYRHIGTAPTVARGSTPGATGDRWDDFNLYVGGPGNYIESGDVVKGIVLAANWSDARMLAVSNVPSSAFVPHPDYSNSAKSLAYGVDIPSQLSPGATAGKLVAGVNYCSIGQPEVTPTVSGVTTTTGATGDWDNGISSYPDGPYINKSDEGNQTTYLIPYYAWNQPTGSLTVGMTFFSPNRQVPSPVMLGSLPTGVDPAGNSPKGWQTLLFRPGPTGHPGAVSPEDELLLDLFWMPVTDPYPISEAFSTEGKVNLNYEIVPFTYITRSTAVRAVLASEKITSVNTTNGLTYKVPNTSTADLGTNARIPLNLGADQGEDGGILQEFRDMFTGTGSFSSSGNPSIFRSATQICDIYMVPQGDSWTSPGAAQAGWYGGKAFGLVGDNERERPYADIYGRMTTKSNTFKVYYTVQSLKANVRDLANGQWNETRGAITGEYIGSTTIERYLDPANAAIQDYANSPNFAPNLDTYYKWRVVDNHQFVP